MKHSLPAIILLCLTLASSAPMRGASTEIQIQVSGAETTIAWPSSPGENAVATFSLDNTKPLISSLTLAGRQIVTGLNPVTVLTVGTRDSANPQGWGAFFDKVPTRPYQSNLVTLGKRDFRVTHQTPTRATVRLAEASGGAFKGWVQCTVYRHSPLLHFETVLSTQEDWRAIFYDTGLASPAPDWESLTWNNAGGGFQRAKLDRQTSETSLAVSGRTIVAEGKLGSLAIFPPPHQFFYPQDEAFNLKFVWHGRNYANLLSDTGFGIRQSPTGDKRYVPWFNAPPGTEQRLGVFLHLSSGDGKQALAEVAKYTHGDRFKEIPGHLTFTSHYHVEHSKEFLAKQKQQETKGVPQGLEVPGFVKTFKARGVNIAHMAEYHYEAGAKLPEAERLMKLKTMHDEFRRLSDDQLLVLPGEEPNVQLGGHWISLFPKPVYWTLSRPPDKAFTEEVPGYGTIYRVGSPADVLALFEKERGLMWTAHARIKASFAFPDAYKNSEFYRSDRFLGAAWKAMPADLSRPTLGWRVLDLLDDSSNWGAKKQAIGEVDIFRMEPDFETYGHMNINYLKLAKLPRYDDGWQPVLDTLRAGQFFTTTGEILIPEFRVGGRESGQTLKTPGSGAATLEAKLEWTFPLAFAEVVSGDGQKTYRQRIDLKDTDSFGQRTLKLPLDLKGRKWVRFEVWDIAANGAFTQPVWLE
jgi:hypothetical protein